MARLFCLPDSAWARIEPHPPHGQPGKPRVDDRRVISGILHVLKVGCRWQDKPSAYGPHTTIYNRYNRWVQTLVKSFNVRLCDEVLNANWFLSLFYPISKIEMPRRQ
ncbi:Putative transposase of IS4/5 family [Methylobacterium sp. UNC378MF]|nr:Putative transposase of IS4/5 family [Methylobacterium sp. UNC378MF]